MIRFVVIALSLFGSTYIASGQTMPGLRDELLRMRDRDQAAREACAKGSADEQVKCIIKAAEDVDRPNTKRLNAIFVTHGFPTAALVGADGVKAFSLIMQHSGDIVLRKNSEAGMAQAFKDKILSPSEYTGFVDRLLVDQGKPQIYGSNFVTRDGKLMMSPVEEPRRLDERRKAIGLPPIAEYVKMMKEIYKLDVVLPQLN